MSLPSNFIPLSEIPKSKMARDLGFWILRVLWSKKVTLHEKNLKTSGKKKSAHHYGD